MNKIQIVINVILVAAVATLFGIVLAGKKPASAEVAVSNPSEVMPVAYLNVDSLLANYTFAQEASEKLMTKQEDARVKMNTKLRTFQNEVADFQRKLENQKLNVQLADSLTNYLKEFNADGRYHVILSNTAKDNVLMAAEQYDITDEVVAGLNARCKK